MPEEKDDKVTVELPETPEVPFPAPEKPLVDFEKGALEEEIRQLKQRVADLEADLAYKQEEESVKPDAPTV